MIIINITLEPLDMDYKNSQSENKVINDVTNQKILLFGRPDHRW